MIQTEVFGMDHTNSDRAERAASAVRAHRPDDPEDAEQSLADLLADLMHWADRDGADFSRAVERAERNYRAEKDTE
jgi:hypothetical protein